MHKKQKHTALGRRPYTVNQKAGPFADSRLKRGADSAERAVEEQLEDLDERQQVGSVLPRDGSEQR